MNFLKDERLLRIVRDPAFWPSLAVIPIVAPWWARGGYLFFTDFVWGPNAPATWWKPGFPVFGAMRLLGFVLPADIVQKSFLVVLLAFLVFAGTRLARAFGARPVVASLVGLFVLFNPFVYDRLGYGQVFVLLGLGCFLMSAAYAMRHLEEPSDRSLWIAAAWLGAAVQVSPHAAFFAALLLPVWVVASAMRRRPDRRFVRALAVALAILVVLNLNWLVGTLTVHDATPVSDAQELVAFQTSGNTPLQVLGNVAQLSGFWGKDQARYADLTRFQANWGKSAFVLAPFALLGLVVGLRDRRRRPLAVGLVLAWLIALVLAAGTKLPFFGGFTSWLFAHVGAYRGMRETQKWAVVLLLCYAVWLSWGLERLFSLRAVAAHRRAVAAFFAAVIVMFAPLMLLGLNGAIRPIPYPADWVAADARMRQGGCEGTSLFLPWHMYMGFSWVGGVVYAPARQFFSCPVLEGTNMEWGGIQDDSGNPRSEAVEAWIASHGKTDALATLGIRRIILAKEVDWRAYAWIDALPGVRLVSDTDTLRTFEVAPDGGLSTEGN